MSSALQSFAYWLLCPVCIAELFIFGCGFGLLELRSFRPPSPLGSFPPPGLGLGFGCGLGGAGAGVWLAGGLLVGGLWLGWRLALARRLGPVGPALVCFGPGGLPPLPLPAHAPAIFRGACVARHPDFMSEVTIF